MIDEHDGDQGASKKARAAERARMLLRLAPILAEDGILIDEAGQVSGPPFPDPQSLHNAIVRATERANLHALTPSPAQRKEVTEDLRAGIHALLAGDSSVGYQVSRYIEGPKDGHEPIKSGFALGTAAGLLDTWLAGGSIENLSSDTRSFSANLQVKVGVVSAADRLTRLACSSAAFRSIPILLVDTSGYDVLFGALIVMASVLYRRAAAAGCPPESLVERLVV